MTDEELLDYYERYPSDRGRAVMALVQQRDDLLVEIQYLRAACRDCHVSPICHDGPDNRSGPEGVAAPPGPWNGPDWRPIP